MSDVLCSVDGCENDATEGGLCAAHVRGRRRGLEVNRPLAKRNRSPIERLTEAALTYAESESDEEFARARDNLRKAAVAASKSATSELTRAALAKLKADGFRLGRPPRVTPAQAVDAVDRLGKVGEAARQLGVSIRTVWRALKASGPRFKKSG